MIGDAGKVVKSGQEDGKEVFGWKQKLYNGFGLFKRLFRLQIWQVVTVHGFGQRKKLKGASPK